MKLPKYSSWNIDGCKGRLFAIQERMEEIENLLDIGSTNVRILGIWGMGGIGKTTIASVVFQRFAYSHFEGCSSLWNVRQLYESFGPDYLRKKLLIDLLKDEAIVSMDTPFVASPFIQDRLCRKRVLIVLDDVDSSDQLDTLVEGYHQLAPGSRIIVTTRNKQVLVKVADVIHKVKGLNDYESLELFRLHAFGKSSIAFGEGGKVCKWQSISSQGLGFFPSRQKQKRLGKCFGKAENSFEQRHPKGFENKLRWTR